MVVLDLRSAGGFGWISALAEGWPELKLFPISSPYDPHLLLLLGLKHFNLSPAPGNESGLRTLFPTKFSDLL